MHASWQENLQRRTALHHSSLIAETSAVPTLKLADQCREMASPMDKAAQARARWDKTRNLLLPHSIQIPETVKISRGKEQESPAPRFNWPSIDSIKLLNVAAGIIAPPSVNFAGAPHVAGPPHPLRDLEEIRRERIYRTIRSTSCVTAFVP
jgi:hypothetical protein